MLCKDYREQFIPHLRNEIDPAQRSELEGHLAGCTDCRTEFESIVKIWNLLGEITVPEPSSQMEEGMNAIISNNEKERTDKRNPIFEWINQLADYRLMRARPGFAFGILLLATGLVAGYILHRPGKSEIAFHRQIDSLAIRVSEMKQMMFLSMLQDQSASQRIEAVSYTEDMTKVDLKVIEALFTTLNQDPNVNVRLATLEALVNLSEQPMVREGLIRSIELQESPVIQAAIADVMVRLNEKRSVKSLQNLLNRKDLNMMVKMNIEKSIQKLS